MFAPPTSDVFEKSNQWLWKKVVSVMVRELSPGTTCAGETKFFFEGLSYIDLVNIVEKGENAGYIFKSFLPQGC